MGGKYGHISQHLENEVARRLSDTGVKSLLVAVSGGADSMALLTICNRISKQLDLRLEAVNCNFHLRGEESNRDSLFTKNYCSKLGVRLHSLNYDVGAYMQLHNDMSTEMACRELRYKDFFRLADELDLDRIAVAHNADDDIETMMLNMLRGSGIRGLKGMEYDNGLVIRPLLSISRKEIERYLADQGVEYITDSSNLTNEYRRNFIRREVLPLLEQRWAGARKSLSKTVNIIKEEAAILEQHYQSELSKLTFGNNELNVYAVGVTTGIVWRFLEKFGGNPLIAEEILNSVNKNFSERSWKLSDTYLAVLERDRLRVVDNRLQSAEPVIRWERLTMNIGVMQEVKSNNSHATIYLPSDAYAYKLRQPIDGDRMSPLGMKGTRLISDIISDAKLDKKQKSEIRVLERKSDGEIIWVTGLKRSRHELISEDCIEIFRATLKH